jgi:integrase
MCEENKERYCTKKKGKTEVQPFWNIEDIQNMIEYFQIKEQWHHYLTFMLGLLLGRRVGDTLKLKWSDLYYENGKMKDETDLAEEKTKKLTRICICGAAKTAILLYIEKTGINPMEDLEAPVFPSNSAKRKDAAYRVAFKKGADYCDINYPVSTHSTRKTFGFWSRKLHPYDVDSMEILQKIYNHSSVQITMDYIGLTWEREKAYFHDMGEFIGNISEGKEIVLKNTPVISIKTTDLRDILKMAYMEGRNSKGSEEDSIEVMNQLLSMVEEIRVS